MYNFHSIASVVTQKVLPKITLTSALKALISKLLMVFWKADRIAFLMLLTSSESSGFGQTCCIFPSLNENGNGFLCKCSESLDESLWTSESWKENKISIGNYKRKANISVFLTLSSILLKFNGRCFCKNYLSWSCFFKDHDEILMRKSITFSLKRI